MAVISGNIPQPVGNTYRGIGSSEFNAGNIAREDWMRGEQSARLAFERESQFNAQEAQKNRDWQEHMSNTEIQRRMQDLKNSGLNPVLAVTQGGASFGSGSSASASSRQGSDGKGGSSSTFGDVLRAIPSIIAGVYTAGASNATALKLAAINGKNRLDVADLNANSGYARDEAWRRFYRTSKKKK